MKNNRWLAALVLAVWAGGVWAASEADGLIQQAIRGADTNTEKAQKLLDAAEMAKDDAKLATALLEKSVEYGAKDITQPAAREVVEKALELLSTITSQSAEFWTLRAQVYRQLLNGERAYEGKERAARKLVPALMEAARLGEAARKYQLAYDAYTEVETIAGRYKLPEKATAAGRAQTYYTQFLNLHKNQDQAVLRAKLALKEIETFLATTGPTTPADGSIDLLTNVDTAKHVTSGLWGKNEVGLSCSTNDGDAALLELPAPAQMPKSYELTVTFARLLGSSTVAIVFPFANRHATLVLDNYGRFSGLEHLDTTSYYYYSSASRTHKRLVDKKAYTATIVVTSLPNGKTHIVASLNGQDLANWESGEANQYIRGSSNWDLRNAGSFGLGANRSQVIFNRVRLKPLK